jgi:hypothetical protein
MIRIALGTIVTSVGLAAAPAAAMITSQSSPPQGVAASYNTIDGRKCWYAGRQPVARSELVWPRVEAVLPPKREPEPPADLSAARPELTAEISAIEPDQAAEMNPSEITGSINPRFEARWQTLAPVVWASAAGR